jgi:glyoxalase family protein
VHHVALGTTVAEHPEWYERIRRAGVQSSPIIDRHYFHSIYFREPGGVLFEIADDGPGFTVDVPLEELGSKVILPPTLEPRRAEIEAVLTPLPDPRAGWATAR